MSTKRLSAEEAKKAKGKTNWDRVDALTDEEIEEAAKADPDSALPTEEELRDFRSERARRRTKGRGDGNKKDK
jgi:hypothetical protein